MIGRNSPGASSYYQRTFYYCLSAIAYDVGGIDGILDQIRKNNCSSKRSRNLLLLEKIHGIVITFHWNLNIISSGRFLLFLRKIMALIFNGISKFTFALLRIFYGDWMKPYSVSVASMDTMGMSMFSP